MEFKNSTPFPAICWESINAKRQEFITTLVRIKYKINQTSKADVWTLELTPQQGELFGGDTFYNDDVNLPIRYESDFVTFKPNTDIIVNGRAQSIRQHPNLKADCRVFVANKNNEIIKELNLKISGQQREGNNKNTNPSFTSFGVRNRTSKARLTYAGTYDEKWLKHQHPYPPHDFDYFYNQAATPELIMEGYLSSGTKIGLHNLLCENRTDGFHIPELHCFSEFTSPLNDTTRYKMNMDTLLIDIEDEDPRSWAVYASYRDFRLKTFTPKEINMKYLPVEILEKQNGS